MNFLNKVGISGQSGAAFGKPRGGVPKTDYERAMTHGSMELPPRGTGLGLIPKGSLIDDVKSWWEGLDDTSKYLIYAGAGIIGVLIILSVIPKGKSSMERLMELKMQKSLID